jgi:hypothetical protein
MIAEINPHAYDADGRRVSQPFLRRQGLHPTFPMGRYVSQPLTVKCDTIRDARRFLAGCEGVSDEEQFGKQQYWQPPEDFEKRKRETATIFALWTWRQLLDMGYDARFVCGSHWPYGIGQTWVEYFRDGKCFLVEPQPDAMPRLTTLRYAPKLSASWDGKELKYCVHNDRHSQLSMRLLTPLVLEYLLFWTWFWVRNIQSVPLMIWRVLHRKVFRRARPESAN